MVTPRNGHNKTYNPLPMSGGYRSYNCSYCSLALQDAYDRLPIQLLTNNLYLNARQPFNGHLLYEQKNLEHTVRRA